MREALIVLCTVPNGEAAEALAEALVGESLAACVNILGEIRSVYRWKGAIERDSERLCLIKTTRDALEPLRARIVALHPYELPEVIALPVVDGHGPYLEWLLASVTERGG